MNTSLIIIPRLFTTAEFGVFIDRVVVFNNMNVLFIYFSNVFINYAYDIFLSTDTSALKKKTFGSLTKLVLRPARPTAFTLPGYCMYSAKLYFQSEWMSVKVFV